MTAAKKIMVVDDEPDVLKVIIIRLRKSGYEASGAGTGRQAIEMARKVSPDLIILDFYLPDINGDGVVKILKADDALKNIPVVLISATSKDIAEKLPDCKVEGCLNKPFEPKDLMGTIKRIIG